MTLGDTMSLMSPQKAGRGGVSDEGFLCSPNSLLPVRPPVNKQRPVLPDVRPRDDQDRLIALRVPTARFSLSSLAHGDAARVQCGGDLGLSVGRVPVS